MLFLLAAAATIVMRVDGPLLTPDDARRTPPSVLADILLATGHPTITETVVGYDLMLPPSPPDQPEETLIQLFTAAHQSNMAGFCEKTRILVQLAPVIATRAGYPPARPAKLSTDILYRWNPGADEATCEATRGAWLPAKPLIYSRHIDLVTALRMIRLLAVAQRHARHRGRLSIDASVYDRVGVERVVRERGRPAATWRTTTAFLTDARQALLRVPVDNVRSVDTSPWSDIILTKDLVATGHPLTAVEMYAGSEWKIGMVVEGDRILHLRMRRDVPPPP